MKRIIKLLTLLISLSISFSCSSDDEYTEDILTVMPYKEEYAPLPFGGAVAEGYVVTNQKGEQLHIGHIYGFDELYEEGYYYTIKVRIKNVDAEDNIADALSRREYYLVEIINKIKQ